MSRPLLAAAAAVLMVGVSACGGDKAAAPPPPADETTTTTLYPGPFAPLTGLRTEDAGLANKPLLTVKIDNHPDARPQFGLDRADVVVEEMVEGGLSRFMALFHSQEVDRLGPVRSLRSTDANWLKAEGGLMAYSGGVPGVRAQLPKNGIVDIGADTYGPRYYKRRNDRPFEHSMYVDTSILRELTPANTPAAKPLFQYVPEGSAFGGAGAAPVSSFSGRFADAPTASSFTWWWDAPGNVFRRKTNGADHVIEGVGVAGFPNVVMQFVRYQPTPYRDRSNSVVDEAISDGSGDAWVFSNGQVVKGRWSRPTLDAITTLTDADGVTIKLTPGQTWLTLMPASQPITIQ